MCARKRVFSSIFLLLFFATFTNGANEWTIKQRHQQHPYKHRNDSRLRQLDELPGIYPVRVPPKETSTSSLFDQHPFLTTFICVLVTLMILCTLIGNAMVCLAICLVRKLKQQPANLLLASLAVADFFVGLIVMPIALIKIIHDEWSLGNFICVVWTTSDLMLCTASILNLCLISVDRYLAVTQPLTYIANRTRKRIMCYILIVWVCAFLVSSTPLIVFPIQSGDSCEISSSFAYQIYATILSFYAPCFIMVVLYWKMWKAAKALQQRDKIANKWSISHHDDIDHQQLPKENSGKCLGSTLQVPKNGLTNGSTNSLLESSPRRLMHRPSSILQAIRVPLIHSNSKNHEKTEDKARKTLGVIMTVFIVCWLPFFILALIKSFDIISVPLWLDLFVLWLGYSNSCLNPLLYAKYNREFRIPFREMLCCRFSTLQAVMRNESFVSKFGPTRMNDLTSSTATAAAVLAIPNVASGQPVKFTLDGSDDHRMNGTRKHSEARLSNASNIAKV
ncbi:5-hydroxytryptamine receptor 1 [Aphelenchoides bicaudatus]|nr:5-hydroxytryptamine receptor 1 [Aphelenchoides bicaudatus]